MIDPRDTDLLQDYLAGLLCAAEVRAVEARVKNERQLAEALVLLAREEALLSEWARAMASADAEVCELPQARPTRLRRVAPRVAAACLLGLLVAGFIALPPSTPAQPHAWLEDVQGEVFVGSVAVRSRHPLFPGDEVRTTGEQSFAVVRYPDQTRLSLSSDTLLTIQNDNADGKRLFLSDGFVQANVAKQPKGHPLILATRDAQVRVLGTRFSSSAGKRGTRIELEEGHIQVSSAGKSMDVEGGRYIVDVTVPSASIQKPEERKPQMLPAQPLPPAITKPRLVLPRGDGPVQMMTFAPDGSLLAVGGAKGNVNLWESNSGLLLRSWPAQVRKTRSLAWSPDSQQIATACEDRTVRFWDAQTGELLRALPRFRLPVEAIAFSPDGRHLAVASGISKTKGPINADITLWDVQTGDIKGRLAGHTDIILSVLFTPDGKLLASGSRDGSIRLWDRETLTEIDCLKCGEPVPVLACSPDSQTLAAGSRDRLIRLWDVPSRQLRMVLQGHPREVRSLAFSPDGKQLASGGSDPSIRVWDVQSGRAVAHYQGHGSAVTCVEFSPDGRTLASAGWDRFVKLWKIGE